MAENSRSQDGMTRRFKVGVVGGGTRHGQNYGQNNGPSQGSGHARQAGSSLYHSKIPRLKQNTRQTSTDQGIARLYRPTLSSAAKRADAVNRLRPENKGARGGVGRREGVTGLHDMKKRVGVTGINGKGKLEEHKRKHHLGRNVGVPGMGNGKGEIQEFKGMNGEGKRVVATGIKDMGKRVGATGIKDMGKRVGATDMGKRVGATGIKDMGKRVGVTGINAKGKIEVTTAMKNKMETKGASKTRPMGVSQKLNTMGPPTMLASKPARPIILHQTVPKQNTLMPSKSVDPRLTKPTAFEEEEDDDDENNPDGIMEEFVVNEASLDDIINNRGIDENTLWRQRSPHNTRRATTAMGYMPEPRRSSIFGGALRVPKKPPPTRPHQQPSARPQPPPRMSARFAMAPRKSLGAPKRILQKAPTSTAKFVDPELPRTPKRIFQKAPSGTMFLDPDPQRTPTRRSTLGFPPRHAERRGLPTQPPHVSHDDTAHPTTPRASLLNRPRRHVLASRPSAPLGPAHNAAPPVVSKSSMRHKGLFTDAQSRGESSLPYKSDSMSARSDEFSDRSTTDANTRSSTKTDHALNTESADEIRRQLEELALAENLLSSW